MKIIILILAIIISIANISFCASEDFIQHQTLICKNFIYESSRPATKFPFTGVEGVVLMFTACSKPEIMQNLTTWEKSHLEELALKIENEKKGLSQDQLKRLRDKEDLVNDNWEKLKNDRKTPDLSNLTQQEIEKLDRHLRSLWNKTKEALANNDIETAIGYFHDRSKESYRKIFLAFPPEILLKIAKEGEIYFDDILGNSVRYHLITNRDGKRYSFLLIFTQDLQGEWKILSY